MNNIAEKIYRLIRERSLGTDLSSLKQRGVKRVSVFKSNQLGDLVAQAVEAVLVEYGIKLSQGDLDSLSEDGRTAFLNLLKERDAYKDLCERVEEQQQTLEIHREVLERQIEREGEALERERGFWSEIPLGEGDEAFRPRLSELMDRTLEERVAALGSSPDPRLVKFLEETVEGLHRDLAGLFTDTLAELRERYSDEGERRVQNLERRLGKMRESLDRAESALERAQSEATVDGGVASIYKDVQGLDPGDGRFGQKKAMLEEIFQINKSIKEQIR